MPATITARIAAELGVRSQQVEAAVELLDGGATVPFIARYRKEATGGLDDTQLRTLEERLGYLRELEDRRDGGARPRSASRASSTAELAGRDPRPPTPRLALEDLYLPYQAQAPHQGADRPRGRARAAGRRAARRPRRWTPRRRRRRSSTPRRASPTPTAALDGARAILIERFAEDADLVGSLREEMWARGRLIAKVRDGKAADGAKFSDYFDFAEPLHQAAVAPRPGAVPRREGGGPRRLDRRPEPPTRPTSSGRADYERRIAAALRHRRPRPPRRPLAGRDRALGLAHPPPASPGGRPAAAPARGGRGRGDRGCSPANLRDLLLAAPAGHARRRMGLDPGFRTGVKVAVVDATGKVVDTATIYPHEPQRRLGRGRSRRWRALVHDAQGRARRDRQRHRLARDRQARRRADQLKRRS